MVVDHQQMPDARLARNGWLCHRQATLARKRSREAGFDHHLVKSVDFGKVQEILTSVSNTETLTH